MYLDCSLEGSNQSEYIHCTVSRCWDIINKLQQINCEIIHNVVICAQQLSVRVRALLWFTLLCLDWLTAVSQTSRKTATIQIILGQSHSRCCCTVAQNATITALWLSLDCVKFKKLVQRKYLKQTDVTFCSVLCGSLDWSQLLLNRSVWLYLQESKSQQF